MHLPGLIPLVQRLIGVDAYVALEADQPPPIDVRQDLSDLGLADAHLALEQDRPVQRQRHQQRGSEPAIREVAAVPQAFGQLTDGSGILHRANSPRRQLLRSARLARLHDKITDCATGLFELPLAPPPAPPTAFPAPPPSPHL